MTEKNDPETQPVRPASAVETPASPPTDPAGAPATAETPPDAPATTVIPPAAPVPTKPSIGERLRTTRGVVAVGLAALIVGGLGGATIHAAVDRGPHDRFGFERGGPGFGGPGGFERRGPGGFEQRGPGSIGEGAPGTTPAPVPSTPVPPTTAPEDESDS